MKTRLMFGLVYLLLFPFGHYANNHPSSKFKLLYVFVSEVDSLNKDVLKLYENQSYEFLTFTKHKGKTKVKREKGAYKLKKGKLHLNRETKQEYKSHPNVFIWRPGEGLYKMSFLTKKVTEIDLLYSESKDEKFWQASYIDPHFGEISNDPKKARKLIEKKPEYIIAPTPVFEPKTEETDYSNANETVNLEKGFLSKDSLKRLKAIIVVGPVFKKWDNESIIEKKKIAAYLRELGVKVVEFYPPNDKWENIVKETKGANIFIYSGHGSSVGINYSSGGICLSKRIYSAQEIADNFKLSKNAIIIFNGVCNAAGSSSGDNSDIGKIEAFKRVSEYAYPFYKINAGVYYANNYTGSVIPFLDLIFQHKKAKGIYIKEASLYEKIQGYMPYSYDKEFEVGIAAKEPNGQIVITYMGVNHEKEVKSLQKFKDYNVAFVARPNFTVVDLFR